MDSTAFLRWLNEQSVTRKAGSHMRVYLREHPGIRPTREEVISTLGGLYRRLRRGDEFTMVDYNPTGPRDLTTEDAPVYAPSTALAPVRQAIVRDGHTPAVATALQAVDSSLVGANKKQQHAVSTLVDAYESSLDLERIQRANEQQRNTDIAASLEDARRDKVFLQDMLRGGRRGGQSVV